MNLTELYNLAFAIASQAHKGQRDKAGLDYILHPVRVSNHCTSPVAKIVALLHDTIEDTNVTPDYLRQQGFPEVIVEAVLTLTHSKEQPYEDYVKLLATNPVCREVKLADLEDNMDVRRLPQLTDTDVARLRKYLRAWHYLQAVDSE